MLLSKSEIRTVITIFVLLGITAFACLFSLFWINVNNRQQQQMQRIQNYQQSNPAGIASLFIHAMGDKDFQLAKKLVVPSQEDRLDRLKNVSYLWNMNCCNILDILNECEMGSGGYVEDENSNNTIVVTKTYWCSDPRRSPDNEISIDEIVVEHDGSKWMIIDWSAICIRNAQSQRETCYP